MIAVYENRVISIKLIPHVSHTNLVNTFKLSSPLPCRVDHLLTYLILSSLYVLVRMELQKRLLIELCVAANYLSCDSLISSWKIQCRGGGRMTWTCLANESSWDSIMMRDGGVIVCHLSWAELPISSCSGQRNEPSSCFSFSFFVLDSRIDVDHDRPTHLRISHTNHVSTFNTPTPFYPVAHTLILHVSHTNTLPHRSFVGPFSSFIASFLLSGISSLST
jgi:hypothetical protein